MAVTGWYTVTTGANDSSVGTRAWGNPSNISNCDTITDAIFDGSSSATGTRYTYGLRGGGIGAVSGINSRLSGIEVKIERYSTVSATTDHVVKLTWDGALVGDNKAKPDVWGSLSDVLYGGSDDLWGSGITVSDILNEPNKLGIHLEAKLVDSSSSSNTNAYIFCIHFRFYTDEGAMFAAF